MAGTHKMETVVVRDHGDYLAIFGWRAGVRKGDILQTKNGYFRVDHVTYHQTPPEMFYAILRETELPPKTVRVEEPSLTMRILTFLADLALSVLYPTPKSTK